MTGPAQVPPPVFLMQLLNGKCLSKGIAVAADLDVAEFLVDGPKSCDMLAESTSSDADALYRLLRMLASVGVFRELGERRFENTPTSDFLRSGHPAGLAGVATWFGHQLNWSMWGELGYSVKTGKTVLSRIFPGQTPWEILGADPGTLAAFNTAMTSYSRMESQSLLAGYDFSRFGSLIDVGGGHGTLAMDIKSRNPDLRVAVFDLPVVVNGAGSAMSDAGIETMGGSFLESVPSGFDAYLMKHIIHDWDDDASVTILSACREALNPGGAVLVCEMMVTDDERGIAAKILDLEMLVGPGGRERTEAEYSALFQKAGLKLSRVVPTLSPMSIIEAQLA